MPPPQSTSVSVPFLTASVHVGAWHTPPVQRPLTQSLFPAQFLPFAPAPFRLFSFGVLLYEMTTGRHPFRKDTPVRTLSAILDATPESIFTYSASAPVPLGWIIERCLAKNPDDRYGSTQSRATSRRCRL